MSGHTLFSLATRIAAQSQRGALGIVSSSGGKSSPEKMAAKLRARELCVSYGGAGPQSVLDVGAEESYRELFEDVGLSIDPLNLPKDMHTPLPTGAYDGAIAMHVLEHSPAPLVVLLNIRLALKAGGWLYVAVPHPSRKWLKDPAHFSVLPPDGWARLLDAAGFAVMHRETGKLEKRKDAVEERFMCRMRVGA